ncbi:hypothetical protein BT96DRAFT_226808 [Gymnopus androsaceus JB14]|uniref:Uncharacterized protein n=1 Tax=Gymnopus androsaceus JB14 TaxID=1447944 RepID=A0A6A4H7Y3_9AGAR|nr:hypothetical protein BT96DRAFT_226808 [Gymnopus androsaceus JB14]
MCRNYAGSSNEPPENIQHAGNVSSFLGEHELQINITNSPNSTGWFLDYIVFESLPNPMTNGEILQAGNGYLTSPGNYSMLAFGPQAETSTEEFAVTPDANATMKFNGTSLSLYGGLIGLSIDPSNTSAYYQIDDQDPVVFQAPTVSPFQNNAQPGPLFTASNLTVGEHSGTVMLVLNASGSIVPAQAVTVDWFYVTSLTMAERASLPSSFNQPSHSGHKLNVTEIVPAVVIPTLLLLMAAVLFCIKRAKQKKALYLLRVSALPHLGSTSSPGFLIKSKDLSP